MKLPTDGIDAFVRIARLGTFQRAADDMHITQTALTRRIQKLEDFLGIRLLDRTTRITKLTNVGREFLPTAERLLEDLNHWVEQLRNKAIRSIGNIRIATIQSIAVTGLPKILVKYQNNYPDNKITILERSGAAVTEAVVKGEADFGIHIHQRDDEELVEETIINSAFSIVCHSSHPFAHYSQIAWNKIPMNELIFLGGMSGNRQLIEAHFNEVGIKLKPHYIVESSPTAIALCRAQVGVAILPENARELIYHDLREIPIVEPIVERQISLIRRKGETLTPAALSLYQLIKSEYL